ncbi:DUF6612 family protein [Streptomyces sp. AK02-01A]|uniref:DUF6612 family protein n=1 Tax=Streptomyces sp. AK02-01A TaxID=3028648 RepID=UPI0029B84C8D|nr:DUF6612 family protein [Streptomyces sp. AK02-01A]MDX3851219.1 DUF1396 domain-containing protein [Streptomyces sp. AK02-01A]
MKTMYRNFAGAALTGALLCGSVACSADSGKPASDSKPAADSKAAEKPVAVTPAAAVKRAVDNGQKLTSLSYSMSGKVPGEGPVEGSASMSLKPLGIQMKMNAELDGKLEKLEIRIIDDGMYINGGKEAAAELGGKTWLKFPMDTLGKGSPLDQLPSQVSENPADESASLTEAKDLKKVGEETVDGVSTTHYTGTVTLAAMRESAKGEDAEAEKRREKTIKSYEDMGLDKLTMDIWVDKDDRTKQFRTQGTSKKGPLDLMIKFYDYNKPVAVKAPPAAETEDLAELMQGAGADAS